MPYLVLRFCCGLAAAGATYFAGLAAIGLDAEERAILARGVALLRRST